MDESSDAGDPPGAEPGAIELETGANLDEPGLLDTTQLKDEDGVPTTSVPPSVSGSALAAEEQFGGFVRFENDGDIGAGGMGVVRKVYDKIMLRQVAMKVMHPHMAKDPELRQRFLLEAHITGQLDHPNIVPVYDMGIMPGDQAFFIMKLIAGETLSKLLSKRRDEQLIGPPLEEFLQIFLKVCDAIDFAHSRGIIHRDLKPSNVMVGAHGEVYVMDWGIAMLCDIPESKFDLARLFASWPAEARKDSAGSLLGTVAYMAPEQAHSQLDEIDMRTDVFGLGGILYEILTNKPPYASEKAEAQLQMARTGIVMPPEKAAPHRRLPPGLCTIAMKALAKNKDDRHATVRALKEDVRAFLRGGGWFHTLRFDPGTVIVQEGDSAESAYIINEGSCEVYKSTKGGARQILRRLGPGDVFGETAVLTNHPRTASVRALDHVTATVITGETLGYEMAEKAWLSTLVKVLAERFRQLDEQLSQLRDVTRAANPEP